MPRGDETSSLEWLIVQQFCLAGICKDAREVKCDLTNIKVNWKKVSRLITFHKIGPLVHTGLSKLNEKEIVPKELVESLLSLKKLATFRNLSNLQEQLRIGKKMLENKVDFIPYKGTILSHYTFQNQSDRLSGDIDILVRKKDIDKIEKLLLDENYVQEYKMSNWSKKVQLAIDCEYNFNFYSPNGIVQYHLEPHWFLASPMFKSKITFDKLLPFTQVEAFYNLPTNILSPAGLILSTSIHHATSEQWGYFKNVCDIGAILNRHQGKIDWDQLFTFCRKEKIINLVVPGLLLAEKSFGFRLPPQVEPFRTQRMSAWAEKKYLTYAKGFEGKSSKSIMVLKRLNFHLTFRKKWTTKVGVVLGHMIYFILKPLIYKAKN